MMLCIDLFQVTHPEDGVDVPVLCLLTPSRGLQGLTDYFSPRPSIIWKEAIKISLRWNYAFKWLSWNISQNFLLYTVWVRVNHKRKCAKFGRQKQSSIHCALKMLSAKHGQSPPSCADRLVCLVGQPSGPQLLWVLGQGREQICGVGTNFSAYHPDPESRSVGKDRCSLCLLMWVAVFLEHAKFFWLSPGLC